MRFVLLAEEDTVSEKVADAPALLESVGVTETLLATLALRLVQVEADPLREAEAHGERVALSEEETTTLVVALNDALSVRAAEPEATMDAVGVTELDALLSAESVAPGESDLPPEAVQHALGVGSTVPGWVPPGDLLPAALTEAEADWHREPEPVVDALPLPLCAPEREAVGDALERVVGVVDGDAEALTSADGVGTADSLSADEADIEPCSDALLTGECETVGDMLAAPLALLESAELCEATAEGKLVADMEREAEPDADGESEMLLVEEALPLPPLVLALACSDALGSALTDAQLDVDADA
jgi:hypothetical protein